MPPNGSANRIAALPLILKQYFFSRLLVILDQKIRISFSFFILFVYEIGSVIGGALSQIWIKIEPYRRHNI